MDCPNCGTYRWDTTVECPNCKAPAMTATDPMTEPAPSIAANEISSPPVESAFESEQPPAPAPSPAPPAPWRPADPYRPSGKLPGGTFGRILLSAIASALVVGLVYHYVTKVINIFVFMPIIGGAIVGAVIAGAVTKGRCRNPILAATVGLLAGLIAYGGDIVLDAVEDRPMMVDSLAQDFTQNNQVPPAVARQYAEKLLTPSMTLKADLMGRAESGVSISHSGSAGIPITGVGYYSVVILETLLFAGFAAALPLGAAKKRYCETCDNWYKSEIAYTAAPNVRQNLTAAIDAHDWQAAMAIAQQAPVRTKAHISIEVQRCVTCNDALIAGMTTDGKNAQKLFERFLPIDDVQRLIAIGKLKSA